MEIESECLNCGKINKIKRNKKLETGDTGKFKCTQCGYKYDYIVE